MNNSHLLSLMTGLLVINMSSSDMLVSSTALSPNSQVGNASFPGSAQSGTTYTGIILQDQKEKGNNTSQKQVQETASEFNGKPVVSIEPGIYPNPNPGYFVVELPESLMNEKGTIRVINRGGEVIYSSDYLPENGNKVIVDLGNTIPGLYFIGIITPGNRIMSKFLVR